MKYRTFCVTSGMIMLCLVYVKAQSLSPLAGARAEGLGYASGCMTGPWSIFNNPAGLSGITHVMAAAGCLHASALPGADEAFLVMTYPLRNSVTALGARSFGDHVYGEQVISAAFAQQVGITQAGIKLNYLQYQAEGFGTKGVVSVSLGGITHLTPTLSLGIHIINLNQPIIAKRQEEHLPTLMVASMAWQPDETLLVACEVEKDLAYKPTWKMGLEYKPVTAAAIRTGINLYPQAAYFGAGFHKRKIILDYAMKYTTSLGTAHQISIGYRIQKKKTSKDTQPQP